ncbi:MAG: nuclear transport factor 2 family protein [Bacteroidetes bacterium]|nr:nuclear transport factor 2 family protein [Bacteroidota bacterium]
MKTFILITILLSTIVITAQDVEHEKEAIKKVIQTAYVEGLQNEGDIDKIDSGIHPDFDLLGIGKNNNMWKYSIKDWKAKTVKKVEDGDLPRKGDQVSVVFKNIDITGNAAMAKIDFYIGKKLAYVDYISLYKFEEGWMMVNKIFYKME